jgi:murein DD-endopeptidase MepM/ murein hydrolase activator NlpD
MTTRRGRWGPNALASLLVIAAVIALPAVRKPRSQLHHDDRNAHPRAHHARGSRRFTTLLIASVVATFALAGTAWGLRRDRPAQTDRAFVLPLVQRVRIPPLRGLAAAVQPPSPAATPPATTMARRVVARPSRSAVRSPVAAGAVGEAMRPVPGAVSGPFGEHRRHGRHPGVDLEANTGDPVRAAAAGVVIVAGRAPSGYGGYGNLVAIDHGLGDVSMYAHLSRVSVGLGQVVAPGDLVGAVGCTGHCTGPHLHFEVRHLGTSIDPLAWLRARFGV